jgi:hypothetical protein
MHRIQKRSQGKLYISYNKNQWNKNVENYMDIDYKKKGGNEQSNEREYGKACNKKV